MLEYTYLNKYSAIFVLNEARKKLNVASLWYEYYANKIDLGQNVRKQSLK